MTAATDPKAGPGSAGDAGPPARALYRLEVASGTLWRGASPLALRAKTLAVLRLLIDSAGSVVSADDMRSAVWGRRVSNANGPKQCVRELRALLGDTPRRPLFIETVGRHGYRLIGRIDLVEPSAATPVAAAGHPLCLGREPEIEAMQTAWSRARGGGRVVLLVAGEAGSGKTRLVDHAVSRFARSGDPWVGWGQCTPHPGSREPYGPLLQALSQLAGDASGADLRPLVREVAPSWLVQMPGVFAVSEVVERQVALTGAAPNRMLRELTELLERLALRRPGVLVLEDLHWADASTLGWLSAWSLRRAPSRLLVIGTARSDDGPGALEGVLDDLSRGAGFRRLGLEGLDGRAVEALLDARFPGHDFPESLGRDLAARTEGHALLVAEVIDDWRARGYVARVHGRWSLQGPVAGMLAALPASVQAAVGRRMDRLTPADLELLGAASVAGLTFSAAAIAQGEGGLEAAERRCEALARRGAFIRRTVPAAWPDGTVASSYAFRHAIHRQVVYDAIPRATRQGWHRRIGERLEAAYGGQVGEIVTVLADHFEEAQDPGRVATYRLLSGEAALRRGAAREAAAQIRLALASLALTRDGPDRSRVELQALLSLGSAVIAHEGFAATDLPGIYGRVRHLSEQLEDVAALVPALCGLWNHQVTYADLGPARELAERLADLAGPQESEAVRMAAWNVQGTTDWLQGRPVQAAAHVARVAALYDVDRHADLSVEFGEDPGIVCRQYGAIVHQLLGDHDASERHFRTGMAIARTLKQPFGLAQMLWSGAVIARERGERALAGERAEALIRVCEEAETWFWHPGGHILAGWAMATGGDAAGLERIRRGIGSWERGSIALTRPYSLGLLAEASADLGLLADGAAALEEASRILEVTGERWYEAGLHRIGAELALREDPRRIDRAVRRLGRAIAVARRQGAAQLEARAVARMAALRAGGSTPFGDPGGP